MGTSGSLRTEEFCDFAPSIMATAAVVTMFSPKRSAGVAMHRSRIQSSQRRHEQQCLLLNYLQFILDRTDVHICRYEP